MSAVYQGAVAPETYVLDIAAGSSGVDLSTVTDAVLSVQKADGTEATWEVDMSNQATSTLTLTHTFESGDLSIAGRYSVYASLTIPTGTVRTAAEALTVKSEYEP